VIRFHTNAKFLLVACCSQGFPGNRHIGSAAPAAGVMSTRAAPARKGPRSAPRTVAARRNSVASRVGHLRFDHFAASSSRFFSIGWQFRVTQFELNTRLSRRQS
jgi:hypothetical protein